MLNTILDIVYNHTELVILLYLVLTAVLMLSRREKANRFFQCAALAVWFAGTAYLVFFERTPVMDVRYNLVPFRDDNLWNVKCNILIFVPFVPALCGAFPKLNVKSAVLSGVLLIVFIELIQLLSRRGICDIDDFLENSLGVLIGAGCFLLLRRGAGLRHGDGSH